MENWIPKTVAIYLVWRAHFFHAAFSPFDLKVKLPPFPLPSLVAGKHQRQRNLVSLCDLAHVCASGASVAHACACVLSDFCSGSRQHRGQAGYTYSFCNKPVRSIPIFISSLLTLSSDSACQNSPQDFLKKKSLHTSTTAGVSDRGNMNGFLFAWLVYVTRCAALPIDDT